MKFAIHRDGGVVEEDVSIDSLIIAGWTGRDQEAVEKHIVELEEMGIARPASTPIFYRVSASRLTSDDAIEVSGGASSGEVEFVLLRQGGQLFVGVGSDHTDREVEAYGVTVSKQMCDKPIAAELWLWEDVRDHWDSLRLRAWIDEDVMYQDGMVTAMLPPGDLMSRWDTVGLADGSAMFCGTLAAIGGIRPSGRFAFELHDPVHGRSIRHGYDVAELAVAG